MISPHGGCIAMKINAVQRVHSYSSSYTFLDIREKTQYQKTCGHQ